MALADAIALVQRTAGAARGQLSALRAATQGVTGQMRSLGAAAGGTATKGFGAASSAVSRLRGMLPSLGSSGAGAGRQIEGGAGRSAMALLSLKGVMEGVAGAGLRLASAGASYVADTLSFRENTEFAFGILAKSSSKARELMTFSDELARSLGKDTVEVGSSVRDLLAKGFNTDMIRAIISASADLTTINPAARVDLITKAFSDIKGKGTLGMEELKQQLADQGVSLDLVYGRLAENLGIKREQVLKTLSAGKVTADVGIASILEAMQQQFSGGKALGTAAAAKGASTLTGALNNARAMARRLILDLNTGPVGAKLIDLANRGATLLDPASSSGKKLMDVLNKVAGIVGGMFENVTPEDLVAAFDGATAAAKKFVDASKGFGGGFVDGFREASATIREVKESLGLTSGSTEQAGTGFRTLGKALGYIVVGLETVYDIISVIPEAFATLPDNMRFIGREIMNGIGEGLDSAKGWLVAKMEALAGLLPDSVRKLLKIQSPSRVFMQIGAHTTAGFVAGLEQGPQPHARMVELMRPPPPEPLPAPGLTVRALAPRSAGATGPVVLNLTVNVDGRDTREPEQLAERIGTEVRRHVAALFEELTLEAGAT